MPSSGTVFRHFLDQGLQRPLRGRAFVVSLALHAAGALLIWGTWGHAEPAEPPTPALVQVETTLRAPTLHRLAGLVGPEAPVAALVQLRKAGPPAAGARRAGARVSPAPAVSLPSEPATMPLPATAEEPGGEAIATDLLDGGAQGGGTGEALAGGDGQGGTRPGRRPIQLFGRVVGGNRRAVIGPNGRPYAPLKESTALRTYDVFPPLPAAQWTGDRPYMVVLDVCVSGEGQVSDVALLRPASRVFDPVVVDAVRTWRYRPRLVDGQAQAFCHVLAIKYERL